jgi:RHS repeat-associated protein
VALPHLACKTDQITWVSNIAPAGFTYDASGNVLIDNLNQYLYDGEGRICAVRNLTVGAMTGYIYDADGRRVAKGAIRAMSCDPAVNGFIPTNDYILGPSGEQVTEMAMGANNTMAWQHTNVYAAGTLLATYDNNGLHFYLNDPLGTRRVQTDSAGVVEQTCSSLPYGDGLACTGSTIYPTEHHFTGKERDAETGNDYFEARYYSSATGRFMSPDWSAKIEPVPYAKLDDPQSLNLYAYVQNNPLSRNDPDGHLLQSPRNRDDNWWGGSTGAYNGVMHLIAEQQYYVAQKQSAAPLTDKNGNVVQGANGKPALIPGGFDVNGVIKTGQSDKELRGYAPMVGSTQTAEDLANFRRGGKWDLQRLSGNFDPRFIDSATILIGMYAQSAGITRNQILDIENFVAIGSSYAKGTPMDSTYTHLPARNVTNTDIGMRLVQSGAISVPQE